MDVKEIYAFCVFRLVMIIDRALKEAEERNRNNNPLREVQRKLDEAVMTVQAYEKHINDKDVS